MVLEFSTIITSKNCNFCMKLCFDSMIEVLENGWNLRFICDKVDLGKTGMVIYESYKPPLSRGGGDLGRTPNVTMDEVKRLCRFIWL